MKLDQLLVENPLTDLRLLGDTDKPLSQRIRDIRLLNNERYLNKVKERWNGVGWDVNIYIINQDLSRIAPDLKIDPSAFQKKYNTIDKGYMEDLFGEAVANEIKLDPNQITIIFTNNEGSNVLPFTPWILAHRMSHVVLARGPRIIPNISKGIQSVFVNDYYHDEKFEYGIEHKSLGDYLTTNPNMNKYIHAFRLIFNYKSVQNYGSLNAHQEIVNEMFADWLLNGHVRYNHFPKKITLDGIDFELYNEDIVNRRLGEAIRKTERTFGDTMDLYKGTALIL